MGELLPFKREWPYEAAEQIRNEALAEVAARYGDGLPDSRLVPTEAPLAYHNLQHTLSVREHSLEVAQVLGLTDQEQAIVDMAASAHDIVQLKPRGVMEQESADWLVANMRAAGFDEPDIRAGELAVLGTEPFSATDGTMIGQRVDFQEYPSERAFLIAVSVACGDMADLYSAVSPLLSRKIYLESQESSWLETPSLEALPEFQARLLNLLASYQFPHPAGEALFGATRGRLLEYQTNIMRDLQSGEIKTWAELLEADWKFFTYFTRA